MILTILSYVALTFSFVGVFLNAHRNKTCWIAWFVADLLWFIYGYYTSQYQIAILHTGYMASNVYGYCKWHKKHDVDTDFAPREG
jgi:hypothetical protein